MIIQNPTVSIEQIKYWVGDLYLQHRLLEDKLINTLETHHETKEELRELKELLKKNGVTLEDLKEE